MTCERSYTSIGDLRTNMHTLCKIMSELLVLQLLNQLNPNTF